MVKQLSLLLFTYTLFATDLTTLYRTQGIDAVQATLEQSLTNQTYWLKVLANEDTRFGYFEKRKSLLTCNKSKASLHYFERNATNRFEEQNVFDALTGKLNGDKHEEGDHKTPVGIYRLTKKLEKLDPFYGPLAYVTSYPNLYDKVRGKNGSGIWIHGVPNNETRETYTKGCIALDNNDIRCLNAKLDFQDSLLIIGENELSQAQKSDIATILAGVYRWRSAWLQSDVNTYLSFYNEAFIRFDGMRIEQFRQYKSDIFSRKERKQIVFSDLIVVPYPGTENNLFMVRFHEEYQTSRYQFSGEKTLIVSLKSDTLSILAER